MQLEISFVVFNETELIHKKSIEFREKSMGPCRFFGLRLVFFSSSSLFLDFWDGVCKWLMNVYIRGIRTLDSLSFASWGTNIWIGCESNNNINEGYRWLYNILESNNNLSFSDSFEKCFIVHKKKEIGATGKSKNNFWGAGNKENW